MRATCLLLVAALAAPAWGADSPESHVAAALADAEGLAPARRLTARYLTLWHLDPRKDAKALERFERAVVRFWANSLSREPEFPEVVRVRPNLWRVHSDDYAWPRAHWEKLLEAGFLGYEPYFHALAALAVQEVEEKVADGYQEYGYWTLGGAQCQAGTPGAVWHTTRREPKFKVVKRVVKADVKQAIAGGPWTGPAAFARLIELTQTQVPIARADWWLHETTSERDRKAGYLGWLGLKVGDDETDFLALGKADLKGSEQLRRLHRSVIGKSRVAFGNRGVRGGATLTEGVAIVTDDFAKSVGDKNALRNLDFAKFDGGEGYITIPNGLFAFSIQNGQRKLIASVPSNIASDYESPNPDRDVDYGDCARCHKEGLRPLNDWARKTYVAPFTLEGFDAEETRRQRAAYLSRVNGFLERGNRVYADALKRCNGLTPAENAAAYAECLADYIDRDLDVAAAAAEVGLKPDAWREKVGEYLAAEKRSGRKPDPLLAALYQDVPMRREHWEEIFPLAMSIARGGK
jgi:hypothetical protein